VELTPRPRIRITVRVIAFGIVALTLLAVAAYVIFNAGTYNPDLPSNCAGKRSPDPLFPIPGIVLGAIASFCAGGIAARLRARMGGS
jgi:hypothetical protein